MSVWYCIPAKRPLAESTLPMWKAAGYRVAVCVDEAESTIVCGSRSPGSAYVDYDLIESIMPYPGYACAVNALVRYVLAEDPDCEWCCTGGDDVLPDPNHTPEEIARECSEHFGTVNDVPNFERSTFGVMQPTGDRYGDDERHLGEFGSAYIDRVCGSPWMGREWCLRINQGRGPLWPEYYHMGEDEELQAIATRAGVLWQRPDLTHYHRHWARARRDAADMPEFLRRANDPEEWRRYKELFAARQAAGFPGSEPL